jgi:predicted nucleic acid-binding protein
VYLVDKSAFEQQRHSDAADQVLRAIADAGKLATCEVVALELLYSTRGPDDYEARWAGLSSLVWLPVDGTVMRTAMDIQHSLARTGQHRRPIPDLLIAATAMVHDATLLHYDKDFDLIAEVTGQPTRWIVPRGSGHGAIPLA